VDKVPPTKVDTVREDTLVARMTSLEETVGTMQETISRHVATKNDLRALEVALKQRVEDGMQALNDRLNDLNYRVKLETITEVTQLRQDVDALKAGRLSKKMDVPYPDQGAFVGEVQEDAVTLHEDDAILIRFNNSDLFLTLSDADHFYFIESSVTEAASNPDCIFIVHGYSQNSCYLVSASTGDFVSLSKQHGHLGGRRYMAISSNDKTNAQLTLLYEAAFVRLVTQTKQHLAALDADGHAHPLLGSRTIMKDAKGLFQVYKVEECQ
jgi:hypothetical protein